LTCYKTLEGEDFIKERGILGIITARGGSKRIPRKNIKLLCGKPLIAYTIETAQKSIIDKLILSSDDWEIIKIAEAYGCKAPFVRPKELATDDAKSLDVAIHAVKFMESRNYNPDVVVLLEPTAPLRTAHDINEVLSLMDGNDSVYSIPLGIFAVKRDVLMNEHSLYGSKSIVYEAYGVDINTKEDFERAEQIINESYALCR